MTSCAVHHSAGDIGQRQRLSHWSRYDTPMLRQQNTDHWTKMKSRSLGLGGSADPEAFRRASAAPSGAITHRPTCIHSSDYAKRMKQLEADGDGRVDPKGVSVFSHVTIKDLHGKIPGDYTVVRPKTGPGRNSSRSAYNVRAREGFRFWYQERPKPTSFGRYGIGAYKTVLGLGNAPRT